MLQGSASIYHVCRLARLRGIVPIDVTSEDRIYNFAKFPTIELRWLPTVFFVVPDYIVVSGN